jgi:hypothetical protein
VEQQDAVLHAGEGLAIGQPEADLVDRARTHLAHARHVPLAHDHADCAGDVLLLLAGDTDPRRVRIDLGEVAVERNLHVGLLEGVGLLGDDMEGGRIGPQVLRDTVRQGRTGGGRVAVDGIEEGKERLAEASRREGVIIGHGSSLHCTGSRQVSAMQVSARPGDAAAWRSHDEWAIASESDVMIQGNRDIP